MRSIAAPTEHENVRNLIAVAQDYPRDRPLAPQLKSTILYRHHRL